MNDHRRETPLADCPKLTLPARRRICHHLAGPEIASRPISQAMTTGAITWPPKSGNFTASLNSPPRDPSLPKMEEG